MLAPFSSDVPEEAQYPAGPVVEALPVWQDSGELSDHRQYIFHFNTMMCPQFASGNCPRHGVGSRSGEQCFCYHSRSQRRRPLVDTLTGRMKYWDVFCEYVAADQECPCGDTCPFAHTQEEVLYHAAKYKTELCGDADCRGEDACCFAHGESELRTTAHERYSFWSVFGSSLVDMQGVQWSEEMSLYDPAIVAAAGPQPLGGQCGRAGSAGAGYCPQAVEVYKHRFCASYPHVGSCRRGDSCVFAHSRDEIRLPLLAPEEEDQRPAALSNDFFMFRFKTHWCPIGVQHDWQTCVYAHNYQDARRHPAIGYGPRPCPHWKRQEASLEYSQRCPLGVRCPFSHGAKEQLYHPDSFKTVTCQDSQNASCPRGKLCAFWHNRSQQRPRSTPKSEYNYKAPIGEDKLCAHLQQDFLTPPFKLLNSLQASMQTMECDVLLEALQDGPWAYCSGGADEDVCGLCDTSQDVVLQDWGQQMCGPTGAVTPTTQATLSPATDSDEAGSADGSDKPSPVQDEDAAVFGSISDADLGVGAPHEGQSSAWQVQGGGPGDCDSGGAMIGQAWGTQVCFGDTVVVPAYVPASGDSGEPTQMLFYMPVPQQMPQMTMVPVALPVACAPAPGPEMAYEIMVPVNATGEAIPIEGACAVTQFGEMPVQAHAGQAIPIEGACAVPQFGEMPVQALAVQAMPIEDACAVPQFGEMPVQAHAVQAMPIEDACAVPQFGEMPVQAHAVQAMPIEDACAVPQFGEMPVPAHSGFIPVAERDPSAAPAFGVAVPALPAAEERRVGDDDDDDDECEPAARSRPRALSL